MENQTWCGTCIREEEREKSKTPEVDCSGVWTKEKAQILKTYLESALVRNMHNLDQPYSITLQQNEVINIAHIVECMVRDCGLTIVHFEQNKIVCKYRA